MTELIVLDDDDEESPPVMISQPIPISGLTQKQRDRMAQQKQKAFERRKEKEVQSREALKNFVQPRIIQTSNYVPNEGADHSDRKWGAHVLGGGIASSGWQFNSRNQSHFFSGVERGAKVEPVSPTELKRDRSGTDDLDTGDDGWRSVRKRPVPGQSFGRGMLNNNVKLEKPIDEGSNDTWADSVRYSKGLEGKHSTSSTVEDWKKAETPPILGFQKPIKAKPSPRPSEQQMQVLNAIRDGKSVFLTGSAGTGKSFVLGYAIRLLKIVHGEGVYVTASTGLAACAIGGTTLHTFAGVGLGNGTAKSLAEKVASRRESRNRWQNAKALILDEISMISGEFFDKLDYVGRIVRKRSQPFGGIQLIVTGDFYQLPPVNPENPSKYFAFEAECWDKCFDLQIELKTVFRQSDEDFVGMLNEIRRGNCPPYVCQKLQNCSGPVGDTSGVIPTRLYPRKVDVGRENAQNLEALRQTPVVYKANDEALSEYAKKLLDNGRVEAVITLSLGAQVMLAKNLDTSVGLVNGARGVIVGFTGPDDPRTAEISKASRTVNPNGLWPIVRFACDNIERMVIPDSWTISEGDVEVAKRTQIPLLLAWALSVHKCQGMTLDRVETDLSRAFDYGMVYVALSRVKSLDGLRLLGFDPTKIKVHPKVASFYDNLARLQESKGSVHTK